MKSITIFIFDLASSAIGFSAIIAVVRGNDHSGLILSLGSLICLRLAIKARDIKEK